MKYFALTIFVFLFSCQVSLLAQPVEEEETGFAFIENVKGKNSNILSIKKAEYKKTYQYKVAKQVFDDLIEARGDARMRVPTFVMSDAERQVAVAKPRKAEITLENKAYEVCQSLGADSLNALAALLSHELIHYYEKHDWTHHFARQHRQIRTGMELRNFDEGLKLETQADYLGGFLAYSAGYQTLDIMPRFLDAVYEQYDLPEEISGYPSLAERKTIATQSLDKLQILINVFETANYLIALKRYEEAKYYLEFVLKDFQSRELYNNLGVIASMLAMKYIQDGELIFGFPFELDGESRLKNSGTKGMGFINEVAAGLLNQAIDYFEQARKLDENYPVAVLNLATAHTLLNSCKAEADIDYDDAGFYARKALKLCEDEKWSKTKNDVYILQGIIAFRLGDQDEAAAKFSKAAKAGSTLADLNLRILNNEPFDVEGSGSVGFGAKKEVFSGYDIDRARNKLFEDELTYDELTKVNSAESAYCMVADQESTKALIHVIDQDNFAFFHLTKSHFPDATHKGIRLGDHFDTIINKYGNPGREVNTVQGQMLVYYSPKRLIFTLNSENKLISMAVFRAQPALSN